MLMVLREVLSFEGSTRPELTVEFPVEEDKPDRLQLRLRGRFNKELAKALDVPYLFTKNGSIVEGFSQMKLDAEIKDVELKLVSSSGELDTYYPEKVDRIVVTHNDDTGVTVSLRASMTGAYDSLLDFFRKHRISGFGFNILPRQGDLFEGGKRVDMTGETEETPQEEPATIQ